MASPLVNPMLNL